MAKTLLDVQNSIPVVSIKKAEFGFSESFQKEYEERVAKAVDDLAPRIVKTLEMYGLLTESGYSLEHQGVRMNFDELTQVVSVDLGVNTVLRLNLATHRVTTFRNGSWLKVFEDLYARQVVNKDVTMIRQRNEVKIREQMGMSKI
jgi:hypothetical protein